LAQKRQRYVSKRYQAAKTFRRWATCDNRGNVLSQLNPTLLAAQLLVIVLASHVFVTVYLMDVLARAFDPFWGPRLLQPISGFTARYLQTLYYAGAVHFKLVRSTIFENIPFDFRAKLDRRTALLCAVYNVVSVLMFLGLTALAVYAAWGVWNIWNELPRPVAPRIMYEEAISL
jgi:hypothetical protein